MKKVLGILLLVALSNYAYCTGYYIRPSGQNTNNGTSAASAWKDLTNINTKSFLAGDIIYLEQGNTYSGKIYFDNADRGTATNPITLTSWNPNGSITGKAIINSGSETAIYAYNTAGIKITDINIYGSSTTADGISFYGDLANNVKLDYILIQNTEVKGFKAGISIGSWNQSMGFSNVTVRNADVHDNVRGGLFTYAQGKLAHKNVIVTYCKAYNNLGDINVTTTNTGSGIVLSGVDGGNINHCIAYNNGQNNRNTTGGPVGIWCYEANNVIIEHNESYDNKAGRDLDGGGFDIDGGSTNCIMQYNYSHGNEGAGYLFAQYSGATAMDNNICRYNISENDGRKNGAGGINIWAASGNNISNTYIYGNTIFISPATNGVPSGIHILSGTVTSNTQIKNNILVTTGGVSLVKANSTSGISLQSNNYWSSGGSFNILWGTTSYSSLSAFRGSGQESGTGHQVDPMLTNSNAAITVGNTDNLATLTGYQLKAGSPMIDAGVNITNPGTRDYYANAIPLNTKFDIGAHEFKATDTQAPTAPALTTTSKTTTSVSLSWNSATDNIGITGYNVYNGTTKVNTGAITVTTYTVSNLTANTTYNFTVKAIDAAGNVSPASNVVSVTTNTAVDTQVPTAPTLSTTGKTSTSVSLSWSGASDNVAVTGYYVYNGTIKVNTSALTGTTVTVNNLTANTAYNFTVKALDAAGNISASSNTISVTTSPTPVTCAATGNILREVWLGIEGTSIPAIPKSAPSSATQITIFESPTDVADNYLCRIRGYVCPPLTGPYTFWIASDDNSELWLSTDDNPANKTKIASVNGWTATRDWIKYPSQKSVSINLTAGQKYYIEALHKEGSAGDNLAVGWDLPDGTQERPIPGSRLSPSTHDMQAPSSVTLSTTGKTTSSVSLSWTAATDNVGVAGYELFQGTTKINTSLVSGTTFTVTGLNASTLYTFTVLAKDAAGNTSASSNILSVTTNSTVTCSASGTILREVWSNIPGVNVGAIPLNSTPTSTAQLTVFEGPTNIAENYGSRIRGYICPPFSGNYTFWIASDDNSELRISTNDDPLNAYRIASVNSWTESRQWTKYPSQKSTQIFLNSSQKYYIEAIQKEGFVGDNIAVGWELPNGSLERPIPGSRLSPAPISLQASAPVPYSLSILPDTNVITARDRHTMLENSVVIYPNPTHGVFNININNEDVGTYNLTVFNAIGNKIHATTIQKNTLHFQVHMNISIVPTGIYYIEIHNEHSEIVRKVFKN